MRKHDSFEKWGTVEPLCYTSYLLLITMVSRKDIDLYLVDITVHLDIFGYSIVLPIMASLNESLGGDMDDLSLLFSSYAVTQFISKK